MLWTVILLLILCQGKRDKSMDTKKVINQLLLERHTTINEMAEKLGMLPQSLRNKISRGNYSFSDFEKMMDILDCDIQVVTRDTRKVFE